MTFNINSFNSSLQRHGLARDNIFKVEIGIPGQLQSEIAKVAPVASRGNIEFFCNSVTLPAFDIETDEIQPQSIGPNVRRPRTMNFPVLPCVFNVDEEMGMVKFFHRWTQHIINYDKSKGMFGNINGQLPFEINYKEEYAATVKVHVFRPNGSKIYTYEFGGAYPVNVGEIQTSWANNDQTMTLSVGFTYDLMKVDGAKEPDPGLLGDRPSTDSFPSQGVGGAVREITDDNIVNKLKNEAEAEINSVKSKVLTRRGYR